MFQISIGDLFRVPGSLLPGVEIAISAIATDENGEVSGFSGFTPLMLPFNIDVVRDSAGSFRVASTLSNGYGFPISFVPPKNDE